MNPTPNEPFSEADLDRLEELLSSDVFKGEAMQLDELQAMLCAVISGPIPTPPNVWLSAAFGETVIVESATLRDEVIQLMMRFYNDIAERLTAGDDWELILYPVADDTDELDYATWADAYIFGCQLGVNWYEVVGDHAEDLTELLQPLFLLNGMLKENAKRCREPWMSATQEKLAIEHAQEDLPELISAIHDFWRAKQSSDEAIRNEFMPSSQHSEGSDFGTLGNGSKISRNEDCPCGSGKKYKQCCGSTEKLH